MPDAHALNGAPSKLHSKPSAGSVALKENSADWTAVGSCGAPVSFVVNGSGVAVGSAEGAGVAANGVPGAGAGAAGCGCGCAAGVPEIVIVPAARQLLVSLDSLIFFALSAQTSSV